MAHPRNTTDDDATGDITLTVLPSGQHVEVLHWDLLDEASVVHAVTTRHGGVSAAPWDTLNLSWARPDAAENVLENRRRLCGALEISLDRVVQAGQVHGVGVRTVGAAQAGQGGSARGSLLPPADALVTDEPDVFLLACFADCVPLLFYDPRRPAVGVAHAGWRGTVADMAGATVRTLSDAYGSRPSDLRVVIGPSAGPCCYEVGPAVVEAVQRGLPDAREVLVRHDAATVHFDLWEANRRLLMAAGVRSENIVVGGLCTIHRPDLFFSHRATGGATGRFGAIIGLRPHVPESATGKML